MSPLLAALLCIGSIVAIVVIAFVFHERGYRRGVDAAAKKYYDLGYECGRTAADNWWLGSEAEADQARRQIWKEEAQR